MPLMSILRLVSSFYLHIYLHVHMYAGICGCIYLSKSEVNLGCQPYCFWRQDLSLLPGTCLFSQSSELHESPCFFFFSSALRLQILVTMSGLSVGPEDGTQDLKQFTSWASSQVLVPAPSNTTCLQ